MTPSPVSILDPTVPSLSGSHSNSSVSSSVSTDTFNSSKTSSLILHRPPLQPIPITPSLNATPTNTPNNTPKTTPIKLQPQTSLTLPLSDTKFPSTPFDITPTHSPPFLIFRTLVTLTQHFSEILTNPYLVNP